MKRFMSLLLVTLSLTTAGAASAQGNAGYTWSKPSRSPAQASTIRLPPGRDRYGHGQATMTRTQYLRLRGLPASTPLGPSSMAGRD